MANKFTQWLNIAHGCRLQSIDRLFINYCKVFGAVISSEIPPDFIAKHREYYQNLVTRLIARINHQQENENHLAYIFMEDEKWLLREIQYEVQQKIKERDDYQACYYRPVLSTYVRQSEVLLI
ncbi:hypothetical protein WA026_006208 [Henosepilachna vigintioctopunctata]|uniref:NADH dehydrogenase [ubiquinone] 1 beta subcomplex subunit 5, mitochondrial n=1 Tax=Henosepilachna vigintioctopunctata TaxID=420089 RepID=A0AAW1TI14_9CUCU